MSFSQRKGLKPAVKPLQVDSIDAELRNGLWSCFYEIVLKEFKGPENYPYGRTHQVIGSNMESVFTTVWLSHFKRPTDEMPNDVNDVIDIVRKRFFVVDWNEVYDFIEFILGMVAEGYEKGLRSACNVIMERENAGYRIVGTQVVAITNDQELAEIQQALASPVSGARQHFETSLKLLSDRKVPDYRNSIKESISAVEAICRSLTGDPKATLGGALGLLQSKLGIHGALKSAFGNLYGYASDENGIRHAMLEEPQITFSDAKFMFVACSAFVNYVVGKAAEGGLKLVS